MADNYNATTQQNAGLPKSNIFSSLLNNTVKNPNFWNTISDGLNNIDYNNVSAAGGGWIDLLGGVAGGINKANYNRKEADRMAGLYNPLLKDAFGVEIPTGQFRNIDELNAYTKFATDINNAEENRLLKKMYYDNNYQNKQDKLENEQTDLRTLFGYSRDLKKYYEQQVDPQGYYDFTGGKNQNYFYNTLKALGINPDAKMSQKIAESLLKLEPQTAKAKIEQTKTKTNEIETLLPGKKAKQAYDINKPYYKATTPKPPKEEYDTETTYTYDENGNKIGEKKKKIPSGSKPATDNKQAGETKEYMGYTYKRGDDGKWHRQPK